MVIKCISVRQPFAYAIAHRGKDVENRTRRTNYRGEIFIHAGKTKPSDEWIKAINASLKKSQLPLIPESALCLGYIIARANLIDCVTRSKSEWFEGPYGYILDDVGPIVPIEVKGRLGLFDVTLPPGTKITLQRAR